MGIITDPDSYVDDIKAAIHCIGYMQKLQQSIRPSELCCKEEEKCADPLAETFTMVGFDSINGVVNKALSKAQANNEWIENYSKIDPAWFGLNRFIEPLKIHDPIQKSSEGHYVVTLFGGNNGQCNWPGYLMQLINVINAFSEVGYHAWIVDIINDCPDDVHTVRIGVRELKK